MVPTVRVKSVSAFEHRQDLSKNGERMFHCLLTKVGVKKVGSFPSLRGPNRRSGKLSVNS